MFFLVEIHHCPLHLHPPSLTSQHPRFHVHVISPHPPEIKLSFFFFITRLSEFFLVPCIFRIFLYRGESTSTGSRPTGLAVATRKDDNGWETVPKKGGKGGGGGGDGWSQVNLPRVRSEQMGSVLIPAVGRPCLHCRDGAKCRVAQATFHKD